MCKEIVFECKATNNIVEFLVGEEYTLMTKTVINTSSKHGFKGFFVLLRKAKQAHRGKRSGEHVNWKPAWVHRASQT